jgi:mercuric ion transport protein
MSIRAFHSRCDAVSSDWLRERRVSWLWPAAFVLAGVGWLVVPGAAGALLAAAGFAVAGGLCVANAIHCRRVHCAVTGPVYLVAALWFLARAGGWNTPGGWIVAGAGVGTALAFVPESLGKLYFDARPEGARVRVATAGTLVAAGLVAACCLGPTLFVVFGLSIASLGALGALEPYRWLFLGAGLASWAVAYRARRRATSACADETYGTPASRRVSGIVLWATLTALLAAAVYPYVVALLA